MRYVSHVYSFGITPFVKAAIIANGLIWFFLVVIGQNFFSDKAFVFHFFGLTADKVFSHFWLWQTITYCFVHAEGFFHILFNMFALWMFGSELERFWGSRFFAAYYLFCGLGAGLIFLFSLWLGVSFFSLNPEVLKIPMVGASGAIFGVLLAYGLIFKDRIIYFMMIFPIRALHFTWLIALLEFASLVNSGIGSPVSHLAHLSGFISGLAFLFFWRAFQQFNVRKWKKKAGHLKILKNDDIDEGLYH